MKMISGLAHLVIACLKSKIVNFLSLHTDYIVFECVFKIR